MDGLVPESDAAAFDADAHAWLLHQVRLLRAHRLDDLDHEHLAELLDQTAKREVRDVSSRLAQLLLHLLKWTHQPDIAARSWLVSIQKQQNALLDLLESKTLRKAADDRLQQAFDRARRQAMLETGLPGGMFPQASPWTLDQALTWSVPHPEEFPARPRRPKSKQ